MDPAGPEVLGIDFGTSNTVAVLSAPGRPPRVLSVDGSAWVPSAIYVDDDGTLSVGRDAERKARLAPERFEANPKRRVDDGEILLGVRVVPVVDAIAAVLRRVGEEARRQLNGRAPDEVHLTHPAQWGASRQNILLAAARSAGLGTDRITLIPEPVAAAAHFASLPGKGSAAGIQPGRLRPRWRHLRLRGGRGHGPGVHRAGRVRIGRRRRRRLRPGNRRPARPHRVGRGSGTLAGTVPTSYGCRPASRPVAAGGRQSRQGDVVPVCADGPADARSVRGHAAHPARVRCADPAGAHPHRRRARGDRPPGRTGPRPAGRASTWSAGRAASR